MHSVVNVGDDRRDIQIYHKSFPDFLLDPSRSKEFAIDLQAVHDCLYSHLVGTSQERDTILQVLGQVMVAEGMPSDVDIIGSPANTLSPDRVGVILGLEPGNITQIFADVRFNLVLQVGNQDQDIKIQDTTFHDFLLGQPRSRELYVDLDDARLILQLAAPIRKVFGAQGTCTILSMYSLWNDAHALHSFSFLQGLPWSKYALE